MKPRPAQPREFSQHEVLCEAKVPSTNMGVNLETQPAVGGEVRRSVHSAEVSVPHTPQFPMTHATILGTRASCTALVS
jgi:hypothetical protein